mmetsp:Transcript_14306/g.30342  ORF Transcript_14306/g.30342 Transcript_14306/m.30342 type:complete len:230 (-) Transcript_14306:421-1110(-)
MRFNLAATLLFSLPGIIVSTTETDRLTGRQRWSSRIGFLGGNVSPGHEPIDFCQDSLKGRVDSRGIQGRRFNKGQVVLFRKGHGFVGFYRSQVPQIALVSNEHDHNVGFGVIPEFLEPPLDVLKGSVFRNVVDQQGTNGSPVVSAGDRPVAFLSGRVPNLCLDGFALGLDGFGGEFHPDGRFGFEIELVSGESTQKIRFTDTGVPNQDNLEQVVVFFVNSSCHCRILIL